MKNENGITMISLIIYIIIMVLIISTIANISASFYSNLNEFDNDSESAVAFSKFNMYFLKDIKQENTQINNIDNNYIILSVGDEIVQYSVQNNSLYRNKVKICGNVRDVSIMSGENSKVINIYLKIGEYEKRTSYTLENNEFTNIIHII